MVSQGTISGSLNIFQKMLGVDKPIGCRDYILASFFWGTAGPQGPQAWIVSVVKTQ